MLYWWKYQPLGASLAFWRNFLLLPPWLPVFLVLSAASGVSPKLNPLPLYWKKTEKREKWNERREIHLFFHHMAPQKGQSPGKLRVLLSWKLDTKCERAHNSPSGKHRKRKSPVETKIYYSDAVGLCNCTCRAKVNPPKKKPVEGRDTQPRIFSLHSEVYCLLEPL